MKYKAMNMNYIVVGLLAMVALAGCGQQTATQITGFEECVAAGNPVMESYPRQCMADGRTFVEDIGNKGRCELNGGVWIDNAQECEGISSDACEAMGGAFNECASACRNDPSAEMCIDVCVQVCRFRPLGGDSDEHGCILSAGYSWCEPKQKCLRPWEEPCQPSDGPLTACTEEQLQADACTMEYMPVCGDDGETYGNACSACASGKISAYRQGECLIGGERDEHGCLGPAGYAWSSEIGACVRSWELTEDTAKAAEIAVAPLSFPVTVVDVEVLRCPGCFIVNLQRNDNQERFSVSINGWQQGALDDGYTCTYDSDCVVKDVHNCCGYYPRCVNSDYEPDIEAVLAACDGMASVCGYPEIDSCECREGRCVSLQAGSVV